MGKTLNNDYDSINGRQSYVSRSGKQWEEKVKEFVNNKLRDLGSNLTVIRGDEIPKNSEYLLYKRAPFLRSLQCYLKNSHHKGETIAFLVAGSKFSILF